MSGLFAILWLAANIVMIVFIIKTIKEKDIEAKKKKRKIWLTCLVVAIVLFIIFSVTVSDSESANSNQITETEKSTVKQVESKSDNIKKSTSETEEQSNESVVAESTQTEKSDTDKSEKSHTSETMDEMSVLQAFYDDFSSSGTLENLEDMVSQYNLYTDHRKDGIGHDTYKVAYTEKLAKVISNSDFETVGNYVIIKFNLLKNDTVDSIEIHTDVDDVSENTTSTITEMNSLLKLFASLDTTTTREDINTYIAENGLLKYAFTHDSAYYIGYEEAAIRTRGRDREGEAVDINFVTSGNTNKVGTIKSAEYAVHTGFNTHTSLEFDNGIFYYEGEACNSGLDAVQKFFDNNQ